jgi:MFS family permease
VGFHLVAYYTDVGLPATQAVTALSVYAFAGAIASGLWGWFTERLSERIMAVVVSLLSAGAIMYLLWVRDLAGALAFAVLFGLTSRAGSTLTNIIIAQYFGRRAYGTITGFVNPFTMIGLGLGPTIGALCFDLTGSYTVEFSFFAITSARLCPLARQKKKGRVRLTHTPLPRKGEPCATCPKRSYACCAPLSQCSAAGCGPGPRRCWSGRS